MHDDEFIPNYCSFKHIFELDLEIPNNDTISNFACHL